MTKPLKINTFFKYPENATPEQKEAIRKAAQEALEAQLRQAINDGTLERFEIRSLTQDEIKQALQKRRRQK